MSNIEDLVDEEKVEIDQTINVAYDPDLENVEVAEMSEPSEGLFSKIFKTKSPDKGLEEYTNSPANFDGSEPMSRILRGLEGFAINTGLAILDIITGVVQMVLKYSKGDE